jgi:hypothetical protein
VNERRNHGGDSEALSGRSEDRIYRNELRTYARYCDVEVAALVVASEELGGVELAASTITVRVEVAVLPALSAAT